MTFSPPFHVISSVVQILGILILNTLIHPSYEKKKILLDLVNPVKNHFGYAICLYKQVCSMNAGSNTHSKSVTETQHYSVQTYQENIALCHSRVEVVQNTHMAEIQGKAFNTFPSACI